MTSAPAKEAGLLPCPFCGSRVIQEDSTECRDAEDYFWFSCQTCGCETEGEHGRDKAIAAWNTRAPSPSPDQPAGEAGNALADLDLIRRDFESRIRWFRQRNKAEPGDDDRLDDPFDLTCANVKARIEIIDQAAALIRDLTARAEAAEGRVLDAAAAYLIETYGKSYGLDHPVDRSRILAALATEAKDGRAG